MKKRILNVIIVICLLLTFALTTAFAVEKNHVEDAEQAFHLIFHSGTSGCHTQQKQ